MEPLSAEALEKKWKKAAWCGRLRDSSNPYDNLNLRLRRSLSWLERAEKEYEAGAGDLDAAFIFYWIAFNAIYGQRGTSLEKKEWEMWGDYLDRIVTLVDSKSVIDATLRRGKAKIKRILENRYVYWRYWKHRHNPAEDPDWEDTFDKDRETAKQAIDERQTKDVLPKLFDRLYTLRNQLLHGGATWASTVNRAQVETGARIMASLVPHFIDLMIKHPDHGWGAPRYPVVRENAPLSGATGTG